jgi:hypothetical protein
VQRNDQLVFLDETSKDGRSSVRKYAWSKINERALVNLPSTGGKRVSALCAMSSTGFFASEVTEEAFTRTSFHSALVTKILPKMNAYPAPRSILILQNAKIHMYKQLQDACDSVGVLLFFLPPYCPQFNPIEIGFGRLKQEVQKHFNVCFSQAPSEIIQTLLPRLYPNGCLSLNNHCGYSRIGLNLDFFEGKALELEKYHGDHGN